jgi:hypothetical protein
MIELLRALKNIGIYSLLQDARKEATSYFVRGLIENGNAMNQDIILVENYLKKVDK